jgi:hypothetical protein
MSNYGSPLNNIKIASPCPADWESMYGNERMRFCGQCKLNVYNVSGMSRAEAESLIERAEGSICVRYFRRADGTVLTQDCPVGWAKVKKRISTIAAGTLAIFISAFTGVFLSSAFNKKELVAGSIPAVNATPKPKDTPMVGVMGNMSMPTPKSSPSPTSKHNVGRVIVITATGAADNVD